MWKITPLNSINGRGVPSPQPLSPLSPTLINRAKEVLREWQDDIERDVRREEKNRKRLRREQKQQQRANLLRYKKYSQRDVVQCKSKTLKNARCKKRTAKSKKCWIHLGKEDNLRIKKSTLPNAGEGLFAYKKRFRKNKTIGAYRGKKMTKRQIDRKYGEYTAPYALCINKRKCRDAYKTTDCAARYSNDARNKRLTNAKFVDFKLKAGKRIKPNEEIFTHYGKGYWKYLKTI